MGREVRKVPKDWKHPFDLNGDHIRLRSGNFKEIAKKYLDNCKAWSKGEHEDQKKGHGRGISFVEWEGRSPHPFEYMPQWEDEEKTHFMLYESTTEGTPLSPAFETQEELARWIIDNTEKENYEEELHLIKDNIADERDSSSKEKPVKFWAAVDGELFDTSIYKQKPAPDGLHFYSGDLEGSERIDGNAANILFPNLKHKDSPKQYELSEIKEKN